MVGPFPYINPQKISFKCQKPKQGVEIRNASLKENLDRNLFLALAPTLKTILKEKRKEKTMMNKKGEKLFLCYPFPAP